MQQTSVRKKLITCSTNRNRFIKRQQRFTNIMTTIITQQSPAANTRLCALAANVLLAVFAPAFPLSLLRQEIRPQAAQAHSLGRYQQAEKK